MTLRTDIFPYTEKLSYINLSSSDWSATGRIYIFGNILDLDFLCSTNAMGDFEKFQYGCNLFSNKQGTIYGFYCSYLQSWLFGSYLQSVNRKRDSAHKDFGGLGSGENLFCQWPVHQRSPWTGASCWAFLLVQLHQQSLEPQEERSVRPTTPREQLAQTPYRQQPVGTILAVFLQ